MPEKSDEPTLRKAHCSECGGIRNCDVRGGYPQRGGDDDYQWHTDWYLLQCRGCEYVFVQTVSTNSEDHSQEYDDNGDPTTYHHETVAYWPALSRRPLPDWYRNSGIEGSDDANLDSALSEVYGALDNDLHGLAAIGIRTTFDVASEILGIDPDSTFKEKLTGLVKIGHIGKVDEARLETLVDAGSASAHRGWRPAPQDLDTMAGILEQFLFESIVQPARKKGLDDKVAKMKVRVPERKPKPVVIETK